MGDAIVRSVKMSPGRRIVCDLVAAGMRVPLVPFQRDMNVAQVRAARGAAQPRPSWCSIFTKAYAKVVASRPILRRACLTFPYMRLSESATCQADIVASVPIRGENMIAIVPIKEPDQCPLLEIDRRIAWGCGNPLERLWRYRGAWKLARLPRPVRSLVWWALLNVSGRVRQKHFGTFAVSSAGNWGVDSLAPIGPLTTILHYGTIDAQGRVPMRLTFDHRVMDGSEAAQALLQMEEYLQSDILAELGNLQACADAKDAA